MNDRIQELYKEAIEEAIEVLEDASAEMLTVTGDENYYGEAIAVLRQALETEQDPVCWTVADGWVYANDTSKVGTSKEVNWETLYTAPPKKQWVGLTDEEIYDCDEEVGMPQYEISSADLYAFARAIETKLREKNT